MLRRPVTCLLAVAFVVLLPAAAYPQDGVDLLPNWIASNNKQEPTATEPTTAKPVDGQGCTASLDLQKHGNPNCSKDQQYFDIDSCQFVCTGGKTSNRTR